MWKTFWEADDGTTALEYGLIGTLIFSVASAAIGRFGEALKGNIYEIIDHMNTLI